MKGVVIVPCLLIGKPIEVGLRRTFTENWSIKAVNLAEDVLISPNQIEDFLLEMKRKLEDVKKNLRGDEQVFLLTGGLVIASVFAAKYAEEIFGNIYYMMWDGMEKKYKFYDTKGRLVEIEDIEATWEGALSN